MTRKLLMTVLGLFMASLTLAQEINWHSVDGGGSVSTGGDIRIIGVIGQSDTSRVHGGTLSLSGGYLPLPAVSDEVFRDSFED